MMQAVTVDRRECGCSYPLSAAGLRNVKPLPLPVIGSFREGAPWPKSIGELAHHSTATLCWLHVDYLRLHIKGLEP